VAKGTLTQFTCDFNPANTTTYNGFQVTNDYIVGPSGEQLTEMAMDSNNTMAWQHSNVWAAGRLIATYDGGVTASGVVTSGLHFYLDDPLGTRRVQTDFTGVVEKSCSSLPFGDGETCAPTPTEHLFAGKERDTESNNDYFGARRVAQVLFLRPGM
jgi:hypothetical protein